MLIIYFKIKIRKKQKQNACIALQKTKKQKTKKYKKRYTVCFNSGINACNSL